MRLLAQGDTSGASKPVEMADKFRADGKIYVVVAVVVVILLGIFVYVARLDRKITSLEKELK
jgi:CcmD family protein